MSTLQTSMSPLPLCVLLDDAVRGVIDRVLRRLGHRVLSCASAEDARRISAQGFQVALVDLNLGQEPEEGRALIDQLQALEPRACMVLTSGSRPALPDPEDGGPLFLKKPFSRGDLVALLDTAQEKLARGEDAVPSAQRSPPQTEPADR